VPRNLGLEAGIPLGFDEPDLRLAGTLDRPAKNYETVTRKAERTKTFLVNSWFSDSILSR